MTADDGRFVDWLARDLARRGTRFAFGVPGGGVSLDLLAAAHGAGMRTVVTAREDAAAIMAGVAGRLAHAPGLAYSTKGPGLASATNGLASALLDRMPTLLVAEGFETGELAYLSHQVFDQAALASGLFGDAAGGKARVLAPDARAVAAALGGMLDAPIGPHVLLADPAGMIAPAPASDPVGAPSSPKKADAGDLDRARDLLALARRPVVVAGLEATAPGCAEGVRRIGQALGAPVLTTYMAKGVVPDCAPEYAGVFTGGAIEQACVGQADLIVLAGLDPVELIRKPWPYTAPVLDLCAHAYAPHYMTPEVRVEGDLAETLLDLAGAIGSSDWKATELATHRAAFLAGMAMPDGDDGLTAMATVEEVRAAFAGGPRLTVDAGAHMFSACAFWPTENPLDLLISNGLASMGFALPAAIAAALHDPARGAVAMTGDGGFLMCLGELKTAAAVDANVVVIVFNDARLSLIDIKREQRQMPDLGLAWTPPDFAEIARGFGFDAWVARDRDELRRAATAAAAATGPRLIDARVGTSGYLPQLRALRG